MSTESPPILLIQNDWDSILGVIGAEAWISCKAKDSPGIHGKLSTLRSLPDIPAVAASDGFLVENLTTASVTVKHQRCPFSTTFVAPYRTFSQIHQGSISSLDVNSESRAVSFSSKGGLVVWDTSTEEIKVKLEGHVFEVYKCGFFPSGKVVLSCSSDMTLRIWCARTGRCPVTLKGHKMAVTDFAFIGRGRNVISTSKDGKVKLWNCGDASCIADISTASSSINCCCVLAVPSSINLHQLPKPLSPLEAETLNKLVIFGCEDGTVEAAVIASRKYFFSLTFDSAINCITVLGDRHFVFGCQNGQVFMYNSENLNEHREWHESNSAVLSLLPCNDLGFFVGRADGSVMFTCLHNSDKKISLTGPNFDPVYGMATDGNNVFTCCRDGSVRMYIIKNIVNNL